MPDTRRSLSSLQTLLADNTAGDISAQDGRDVLVSNHPENVVQTAAFASEPSSGQLTGDLFLPSDGFQLERYSGSGWAPWGPIFPFTKPVSGDFAWINQGSAAVSTTNGGVALTAPTNGGAYNLRIRKKAAPTPPYTITAAFLWTSDPSGVCFGGLCWRQSSDGKLVTCGFEQVATGPPRYHLANMTDASNVSAFDSLIDCAITARSILWMQISDDNSNRIVRFSPDGQNWVQAGASVGRTTFLTGDEVGFFINPHSGTGGGAITLLHWAQS